MSLYCSVGLSSTSMAFTRESYLQNKDVPITSNPRNKVMVAILLYFLMMMIFFFDFFIYIFFLYLYLIMYYVSEMLRL